MAARALHRTSPGAVADPSRVPSGSAVGGAAVPESVRSYFEPRFGHDFGSVRIHADRTASNSAAAIGARAYTVGSDVYFGEGQFEPSTPTGQRLLAHELAHVVQHSRADVAGCNVVHREPVEDDETATSSPITVVAIADIGAAQMPPAHLHEFLEDHGSLKGYFAAFQLEASKNPGQAVRLSKDGATIWARSDEGNILYYADFAPGSSAQYFRIRMIAGGEGGEVVGAGVYTFEIQSNTTSESGFLTFKGAGPTAGLPAGGLGPSEWTDFTTTVPMKLTDFQGRGAIGSIGAYVGGGGSMTGLAFFCGDLPTQTVDASGFGSGGSASGSVFVGVWTLQ